MNLCEELAQFIVHTDYAQLPPETVLSAKERLLDTTGAMLAGRAGWIYSEALMSAMELLGPGGCPVVGDNLTRRYPPARAAALDATFAHAVELDDGHKFAGVHAGAAVIPTALVMGQELRATGEEVLTAIVLGYEVVYRLAVAQSPELIDRGFHPSSTCDTVGAMAVAGKLMKLDEQQMANGLGTAALEAAGLMEATVSGQQSKCVLVGNAVYSGISCAYIARAGLEGCRTAFEGKSGLFRAMSKPLVPEDVLRDLGKPFWIADTYNKFYPTCRHAQPAIEAALNIAQEHGLDPELVERVDVGTHHVAYDLTGTIKRPRTPGEAKFSIAYGVAVALYDHGVSVMHLKEQAYSDERYLRLADLVSTRVDEAVDALYPRRRGAKVQIIMKDGSSYDSDCYDLKGSPQNPVGFDELVRKFRVAANGLLSEEATAAVLARCGSFEAETDVGSFLALLNW